MGIEFQLHRGSIHLAKGLRQVQIAENKVSDANYDSAAKHVDKALDQFADALNNFMNAEDDAAAKAGSEIDKGTQELQKAKDAYAEGKYDSSDRYLEKAMENFDEALNLMS